MLLRIKIWIFHRLFILIRPMTLGVRILLRDEQGRILLVRHGYIPGWHLPGGGVERGHTALHTVSKELLEETGLEAQGKPELLGVYANQRASKRDHVLFYEVKEWRRTRTFKSNMEIREISFFKLDGLPTDTSKATHERLAELTEGKEQSEYW